MAAEVIGSVVESELLDVLVKERSGLLDAVEAHMSPPLPTIGSGEPVSKAVGVLEKSGAAVVLVDGKPKGLITRQDLLAYLADASN